MQWQTQALSLPLIDAGRRGPARSRLVLSSLRLSGGKVEYQIYCTACHGAELEGAGIAPTLAGARFDLAWRGKPADILAFHVRRMPPGDGLR